MACCGPCLAINRVSWYLWGLQTSSQPGKENFRSRVWSKLARTPSVLAQILLPISIHALREGCLLRTLCDFRTFPEQENP